jgi:hypothetical protein
MDLMDKNERRVLLLAGAPPPAEPKLCDICVDRSDRIEKWVKNFALAQRSEQLAYKAGREAFRGGGGDDETENERPHMRSAGPETK